MAVPLLGVLVISSGCSTVRYLSQAAYGQLEIANRSRPISEVLKDERTAPKLKKLLEEIPSIKKFGEEYGLKPTSNYQDYVQLDRPAASWVVSACEPLKFESKAWVFPIVGSFPYLGWFDLNGAREYAEKLRNEGYDVDLRGAAAYSTLGWFRDPVLSSMISEGDSALGDLVDVVIHESVHATLYINGQAYFNESVASFIAEKLAPLYLEKTRGKGAKELRAYLESEHSARERGESLRRAHARLDALYRSDASDSEKLESKKAMLEELRTQLNWKRDLNNATLIQFKTYGVGRPEYETLFRSCGSDWTRFWAALHSIDGDRFRAPHQEDLAPILLPLASSGCITRK